MMSHRIQILQKTTRQRKPKSSVPPFIRKLRHIWSNEVYQGLTAQQPRIISWSQSGNSIMIHDKEKFCKTVIPEYFNHKNANECLNVRPNIKENSRSFDRQMNAYQFKMTKIGRTICFTHEDFIQSRPDLMKNIKRKEANPDKMRGPTTKATKMTKIHNTRTIPSDDDTLHPTPAQIKRKVNQTKKARLLALIHNKDTEVRVPDIEEEKESFLCSTNRHPHDSSSFSSTKTTVVTTTTTTTTSSSSSSPVSSSSSSSSFSSSLSSLYNIDDEENDEVHTTEAALCELHDEFSLLPFSTDVEGFLLKSSPTGTCNPNQYVNEEGISLFNKPSLESESMKIIGSGGGLSTRSSSNKRKVMFEHNHQYLDNKLISPTSVLNGVSNSDLLRFMLPPPKNDQTFERLHLVTSSPSLPSNDVVDTLTMTPTNMEDSSSTATNKNAKRGVKRAHMVSPDNVCLSNQDHSAFQNITYHSQQRAQMATSSSSSSETQKIKEEKKNEVIMDRQLYVVDDFVEPLSPSTQPILGNDDEMSVDILQSLLFLPEDDEEEEAQQLPSSSHHDVGPGLPYLTSSSSSTPQPSSCLLPFQNLVKKEGGYNNNNNKVNVAGASSFSPLKGASYDFQTMNCNEMENLFDEFEGEPKVCHIIEEDYAGYNN